MEYKHHQIFNAHRAMCCLERQCRLVADSSGCGLWPWTYGASHSACRVSAVKLFGLSNEQDLLKLLKPRCHWPGLNQQLSASRQGGTGFGRAGILMETEYWGHTWEQPGPSCLLLLHSSSAPLERELVNICLALWFNLCW